MRSLRLIKISSLFTIPIFLLGSLLDLSSVCLAQNIIDVLSKNCFVCHGPKVKPPMSGLTMANSETLKAGGKRGPAIVPRKAEESLLYQAVRRTGELKMPPSGPLQEKEIEIIREWINAGAIWPVRKETDHWAYRPVVKPTVPTVKHPELVYNPVDAFIVSEYEKKGLFPQDAADKPTLLRRVAYDLVGLPPTSQDLDYFLSDNSPKAYENLVDRLLENEQHGVNYASHWLDVLRYADVDEHMPAQSGIYRWREWVIHSLNRDLPYDQFVKAQLMGDLMNDSTAVFGTGFLARGAEVEKDEKKSLAFAVVETAGPAFLGATVGCAKCHDHMFDPIRQADYYGLKAIFDPLVIEKQVLAGPQEQALYKLALDHYEERQKELQKSLDKFLVPFKEKLQGDRISQLPADAQEAIKTPEERRTPAQKKIAEDYAPIIRIDPPKYREIMTPEQIKIYEGLRTPLLALAKPADLETFWTVREDESLAKEKSHILDTGDPDKPKGEVGPMFHIANIGFEAPRIDCEEKPYTTGSRQKFVEWVLDRKNPLFARVAVNRLWQWHFGVGLVKTPSDFGSLSEPPTHPELLDWLAVQFVESGYSMKTMHRLIVTSRTYQLSSKTLSADASVDPDNLCLWRFPIRRMTAEELRDSILLLSGKLDLKIGGKSFTDLPDYYYPGSRTVIGNLNRETNRRGIYMVRGYDSTAEMMPNYLHIFDVDNGKLPTPVRTRSITALQALTLMNSPLVEQASLEFGRRLIKETKEDLDKAIELGFVMALSRPPSEKEKKTISSLVKECKDCESSSHGMEKLGWVLVNLDEFIFIR